MNAGRLTLSRCDDIRVPSLERVLFVYAKDPGSKFRPEWLVVPNVPTQVVSGSSVCRSLLKALFPTASTAVLDQVVRRGSSQLIRGFSPLQVFQVEPRGVARVDFVVSFLDFDSQRRELGSGKVDTSSFLPADTKTATFLTNKLQSLLRRRKAVGLLGLGTTALAAYGLHKGALEYELANKSFEDLDSMLRSDREMLTNKARYRAVFQHWANKAPSLDTLAHRLEIYAWKDLDKPLLEVEQQNAIVLATTMKRRWLEPAKVKDSWLGRALDVWDIAKFIDVSEQDQVSLFARCEEYRSIFKLVLDPDEPKTKTSATTVRAFKSALRTRCGLREGIESISRQKLEDAVSHTNPDLDLARAELGQMPCSWLVFYWPNVESWFLVGGQVLLRVLATDGSPRPLSDWDVFWTLFHSPSVVKQLDTVLAKFEPRASENASKVTALKTTMTMLENQIDQVKAKRPGWGAFMNSLLESE